MLSTTLSPLHGSLDLIFSTFCAINIIIVIIIPLMEGSEGLELQLQLLVDSPGHRRHSLTI